MAADSDMTPLPCITSPTSTLYQPCIMPPTSFHRHGAMGCGCSPWHQPGPGWDESGFFPSQGEGTPFRESRVTARGDRRGAGGRDGGSSRGWQERAGMTCSQQRWPHFPLGLLGASPIASPAASAPLQAPQGTQPLASPPEEGQSATNCIPTQGGLFSSSRYGNGPPELTRTWYPGERHGRSSCGMLCILWHHLQPRLQCWRTCSLPG